MAETSTYPPTEATRGSGDIDPAQWWSRIEQAERKMQRWRKNGQRIVERYRGRDEDEITNYTGRATNNAAVINLHWSNVQMLLATAYARTPKPEVARRQKSQEDTSGQTMAETVQKLLEFSVDTYDFDSMMEDVLIDFWNTALGQVRLRYKPYFKPIPRPAFDPKTGEPIVDEETGMQAEEPAHERIALVGIEDLTDDPLAKLKYTDPQGNVVPDDRVRFDPQGPYMDGEPLEQKVYEEMVAEYVPWDCFGWDTDARTWQQVPFAWIKYPLTQAEVARQFGKKIAREIPYQAHAPGDTKGAEDREEIIKRADVFEVFDKQTRRCFCIVKGYPKAFQILDDPYKLEGFYPFPKPLWGTITSNRLIPVPFFQIVQDLYYELDEVQRRIMRLTSMLKVRGVYNASLGTALQNIFSKDDGYLEPQQQWTEGQEKGGINGAVSVLDLGQTIAALQQLTMQRESIIQKIYEVTGLSDIMRGATRASESAAAQKIKQEYVSTRINREVRKIARFVRDVLRIMAEFITEHFGIETAQNIVGNPINPQDWEALRNDITRNYKIDVQTDTMMVADEEAETERREKVVNSISGFLQAFVPAVQAGIMPPELGQAVLHYIASASSKGREFEKYISGMNLAAIAPPPPAPPGAATGTPAPPAGAPPQ